MKQWQQWSLAFLIFFAVPFLVGHYVGRTHKNGTNVSHLPKSEQVKRTPAQVPSKNTKNIQSEKEAAVQSENVESTEPNKTLAIDEPHVTPEKEIEALFAPGSWKLSIGAHFQLIESIDKRTGAMASLVSESQPEVSLQWDQNWTAKFRTFFTANMVYHRFLNVSDNNKQVESRQKGAFRYGLGGSWQALSALEVSFLISYGDFALLRHQSEDVIALYLDTVMVANMEARWRIVQTKHHSISVVALYEITGAGQSSDLGMRGGSAYGGRMNIERRFSTSALGVEPFYKSGSYSAATQDYNIEWLGFTVYFKREF